jgi:hypothetical protein
MCLIYSLEHALFPSLISVFRLFKKRVPGLKKWRSLFHFLHLFCLEKDKKVDLSSSSLHSDPPVGTDVPTFTDLHLWIAHPSRRWSTLIGIGRLWSSIPTEAKPAHLGRSSPTVVCLSWPTLVDLGPGWWQSKLGRQFALVVLVITVSTSCNSPGT